jgi:uncharacterized protein YcfL
MPGSIPRTGIPDFFLSYNPNSTMKSLLKFVASACLLLAACNTSVNTIETRHRTGENIIPREKLEKIIFNPSLHADLAIDAIRESMKGSLWQVQVEFTNVTGGDIEFQYRFEWLDPQGMAVHTPTSTWLPRKILAGETLALTGLAPNPDIADFRLKIAPLER